MTDKEVDDYRSSPEGKAYAAIYALQNAMDELSKLPPEVLAQYGKEIATEFMRLGNALAKPKLIASVE